MERGGLRMPVIKIQSNLRLDPVTHCKIQKIAREEHRSLANMIDHLVKKEIKRYEMEHSEIIVTEEDIVLA